MKKLILLTLLIMVAQTMASAENTPVAPNGITPFPEYMKWKVIAPSYREDKGHIRVITGNKIAYEALCDGKNPLPDGSVLAKVAWKAEKLSSFPVATVPGTFMQVEFMVKDAAKFKKTGGWGFARFLGNELKPYGKDADFVVECFGCHMPVANNDYLFTRRVKTPEL